jgi:hypothetical protein
MSMRQMGVYETPDGWFVSARAVVEHEILGIMQVVDNGKGSRHEAGGRVVGIGPDGHGWQDRYHVKIQLDARRITRRTSQTEMMLLISKGAGGCRPLPEGGVPAHGRHLDGQGLAGQRAGQHGSLIRRD